MSSARKALQLGARLMKIAAVNPSRLRVVLGTALSATDNVIDPACDLSRLQQVSVNDLLPDKGPPLRVNLALFPRTHASISVLEFTCLILLLKKADARNVFEFGTYKGVSITQLALNLPEASRILTLDLPEEKIATQFQISDPEDAEIAAHGGKGSLVPEDVKNRIQFLKQDSAAFDDSEWAGKMDFVFVDGAHNMEYVRNDSEKGWRMLRRGGIIAWHDCRPQDPAVVRYLLSSNFQPAHILGTTLAFAIKS